MLIRGSRILARVLCLGLSLLSHHHRRPASVVAFQQSLSSSPFSPASTSFTSSSSISMTTAPPSFQEEDPYLWLEDVEAEECLDFARKANQKCLDELGDPSTKPSYQKILNVLESKDRIPHVTNYGYDSDGNRILFNLWKDQDHPKGLWRKTTLESYKSSDPKWETVLDLDALSKQDDIAWVWKGSRSLPRKRDTGSQVNRVTRSLLSLSRGGSDAIHLQEFDLEQQEFVRNLSDSKEAAFDLPEAKTRASYKSRNVLLVGSDFGSGSLTDSGYPRTVKEWVRGTPIEDAPTVFEGKQTDVAVNGKSEVCMDVCT